jgi:two-component system, sensor histidine kinase
MASHELRAPAQDLSNRAAVLAANRTLAPQALREAEEVQLRAQQISEMFGQMLNLSLLDAGKRAPNKRALALGPLLKAIVDERRKEAEAKGLELRLVATSLAVETDGAMLTHIVGNLVSNAIRYTPEGRVLVGVRRHPESGTVSIEVVDTGPGIAPEDQEKVFGAFYQGAGRASAQGAGLGLAIVQRFAALLEAPIDLSSKVGAGTRFAITVPIAVLAPQVEAAADIRLGVSRLIALVDDNEALLESTTALLRSWGHRVTAASSGDGIVAALRRQGARPDLVICDFQLGADEDGIAVIERLRASFGTGLPAMLLTGDTRAETQELAQLKGIPLLQSPVPAKNLRAAVAALTARPRQPAE